ncbi:unnamed protein product [Dimorphilus gyrociliatus]|uniref:U3 small nucleolar RNA-associated protein 6 N-terminal domain-containing protein n=1 Tax=Dimorphilus gyrociliatus TaxID=2664684 RepID=A0A7I8VIZ4_9ANNE|nr:unnamed protein product [Dimorphilus gyrociliatus]
MAEFVQQSMEQMLPEIQQLRRIGLMSKEETNTLIRRRKQYEYKLRRRTREKRDYIKYIKYEMNVLDLIKKRRKKIGYNHKLLEIDIQIVKRIHKLFRLAEARFQDDVKLWLSHIDFAKTRKEKTITGKIYARALQTHSRNSSLWIGAARYQFYTVENMDLGRTLFQKGLHINQESEELWFEYFKSEMCFTEKMMERAEKLEKISRSTQNSNDAILNAKLPILVYNKMIEALPNSMTILFKIASYCSSYKWGNRVESHILENIKERFPKNPLIFSLLAENSSSLNESIEHLKKGLRESDDMKKMCSIYAAFCLKSATEENVEELLGEVFNYVEFLDEESLCKCIICMKNMKGNEKAIELTSLALRTHKNSTALWSSKIMLSPHQETRNIIKKATNEISPSDIWTVFETALEFVTDSEASNEVYSYVTDFVSSSISNASLKLNFFQWVVDNSREVDQAYQRLIKYYPKPSGIYSLMIQQLNEPDVQRKKVAEEWIREHPKTIDSWITALEIFQLDLVKKGTIFQRALQSLSPADSQELRQRLTIQKQFSNVTTQYN